MTRRGDVRAAVAVVAALVVLASIDAGAQPASAASPARLEAVDFAGRLEPGMTYVADMIYDANALRIWRPIVPVVVPRQHAWTIAWSNLAAFPALQSARTKTAPQRFRFRVIAADMSQAMPGQPWTAVYRCEVLGVTPITVESRKKAGGPALNR